VAESVIGLCTTELAKPTRRWRAAEQREVATVQYVVCFNRRRLCEACGNMAPARLEEAFFPSKGP
jgi:hypothetical protein